MSAPRPLSCLWPLPYEEAIRICAGQGQRAAVRISGKRRRPNRRYERPIVVPLVTMDPGDRPWIDIDFVHIDVAGLLQDALEADYQRRAR